MGPIFNTNPCGTIVLVDILVKLLGNSSIFSAELDLLLALVYLLNATLSKIANKIRHQCHYSVIHVSRDLNIKYTFSTYTFLYNILNFLTIQHYDLNVISHLIYI